MTTVAPMSVLRPRFPHLERILARQRRQIIFALSDLVIGGLLAAGFLLALLDA